MIRPPATDAELIRSFDARIRALEAGPASWRIGQWVLSDQGTSLVATRPAMPTLNVGPQDATPITADITRGFIVDIEQAQDDATTAGNNVQTVADALVNVHTGGSSTGNAMDAFVTHLQGVWNDLFGVSTPQPVLQDSAIPNITKDMSTDLDAIYTAHVDAVGSGACMVRTSTATVTISTGGTVRNLPTSFFGTNTVSSADITSDLTNAKFTVSLDGWYRCDLCLKTNSTGFTNAWNFAPVLLKNGSAAKYGNDGFDAGAGGGANSRYIASSFEVYLVAGDYVQAGFNADNGTGTISNFLTGEATGTQSYFSISLSNRSLA